MEAYKAAGAPRGSREKGIEPPDQTAGSHPDSTGFRLFLTTPSGARFGVPAANPDRCPAPAI
jgi:hypothetical protein